MPELTAALTENQQDTYHQIIRSVAIPEAAFEDFCSWSEDCYTRNCIFENEKFEKVTGNKSKAEAKIAGITPAWLILSGK